MTARICSDCLVEAESWGVCHWCGGLWDEDDEKAAQASTSAATDAALDRFRTELGIEFAPDDDQD
jgi:hypothetical protein